MKDEPVLTAAGLLSAVGVLIGLLVVFGVPITPEQQAAILKAVVVLGPMVLAWWTRRRVVTVAKNAEQVERARAELPPGAVMLRGGQNPQDGR